MNTVSKEAALWQEEIGNVLMSRSKILSKLLLNRYLLSQFSVSSFKELAAELKKPAFEEIDNEGVTGFYKQIVSQLGTKCKIPQEKLAEYDLNIVAHLKKINERRMNRFPSNTFNTSRCFLLVLPDNYFNNRQGLLDGLNEVLPISTSSTPMIS